MRMWPFFSATIEVVILSSWMIHAGCVFVADIHPSRPWPSGSFKSMRWTECVHRLDLSLYSYSKEFLENGVRTHVNFKGKIPSTGGSEDCWLLNVPATCECISGTDLLNFDCCHTEIEVADPTFHLTQSQYTDTRLTSPSTDPITSGTWHTHTHTHHKQLT